jgi:hypothetical protein
VSSQRAKLRSKTISRGVWIVWGSMFAVDLFAVTSYGSYVPFFDDWGMVPAVTGDLSIGRWVWVPQNEHWVPLPKLILYGLLRLAACDFRSGMVASVVVLAALAAGMMMAASRVRGHMALSDAFFPLVWLHGGHSTNLLWGWQFTFTLPTALAGAILITMVRDPDTTVFRWTAFAGACLALLPLCGASGLAMAPALSLWFLLVAVATWRRGARGARLQALVTVALVGIALLLAGKNAMSWERPDNIPHSPSIARTLVAALQFCSISLGPVSWPVWPAFGLLVVALAMVAGLLQASRAVAMPGERLRATGVILFIGAMGCLALALGWGRAGLTSEAGLASRYICLSAPWLCSIYFGFLIAGTPVSRFVITSLVIVSALMAFPNTSAGFAEAQNRYYNMWHVKHYLEVGLSAEEFGARYSRPPPMLLQYESDLANYVKMLRRAGVHYYRNITVSH